MKNSLSVLFLFISVLAFSQAEIKDIIIENLDGDQISLAEVFDGKRNTLISVGGTWCKPCLLQKPFVASLGQQYPQYLKVVFLFWRDKPENVIEKFGESENFENYYLATFNLIERLNVMTYPTHILIDPNGNIISNDVSINDVGALIK